MDWDRVSGMNFTVGAEHAADIAVWQGLMGVQCCEVAFAYEGGGWAGSAEFGDGETGRGVIWKRRGVELVGGGWRGRG